ncbi:glutathione binding-like protein [Trinickia caryophylli]|uniref:Glutathione S-transferase n=1 Tax=Trinickia caryophylli TaxID=28094 RepID=A0A1X7E819_TRICW|nr:glutathione binding-like protein [Trinickia caryophylli]PMS13068.1 glutathione S-transferase [Trinickia caryophylli]TRX14833.1 glutathione S-transferase [Trinickia caryophylli]WQE14683.1 glutathione binding-like protein [Trinickia caryophylli]SMF28612.1 glutathione S-transferase [Trinickia caryophylli]GLU31892.1 glutathione S-transferase [Trinickia caryophylli]
MELFFSPLACSLATRIAFYEAGYDARYTMVDTKAKRLPDGSDFLAVNPLGMVPVLRLDDGTLLTENVAILSCVADCFPDAHLAPTSGVARAKFHQWLAFASTELHKGIFTVLLDRSAPAEVKRYAREKLKARFDFLHARFAEHDWLLDTFSAADAYLAVVLSWTKYCDVDLAQWPAVEAYYERVTARPAVARAMSEEFELYREREARRKTA